MKRKATRIGFGAIFLWSSLALFTSQVSSVPPMLSLAITLTTSSLMLAIVYFIRSELVLSWTNTSFKDMALGGSSYFLYHLFYFYALHNAPNIIVGMLAYCWPLLIILTIGLYDTTQRRWRYLIGALLGFAGTGLMLQTGAQMSTVVDTAAPLANSTSSILGYAAAIAASLVWAGYSLRTRRLNKSSSSCIIWYCLVAAMLSFVYHILFEPIGWQFSKETWIAMLGLGFGPVGFGFLCWEIGARRGNLSHLAVLCYIAPLMSLAWTIAFDAQEFTQLNMIASAIIILGMLVTFHLTWSQRKANKVTATS